jgi:thioester reductase-like protein
VNVSGTQHVLGLLRRAPNLHRLHYVSTCYVSGTHRGRFMETDLECGQGFHNHYEATKYEAEVLVRRAMQDGVPCTVYRPSVVVGDSRTGETQKFDGPYFVIRFILRQRRVAVLPVVGNQEDHTLNVVPSDFVVDAIEHLSTAEVPPGLTFHLADPAPPTNEEFIRAIGEVAGIRVIQIPLPRSVAKGALAHVPGLARFMGIPAAAVEYFTHPADYDTSRALSYLEPAGIRPPALLDYLPTLMDFLQAHPEISGEPMR